jgi:hypothetical protein
MLIILHLEHYAFLSAYANITELVNFVYQFSQTVMETCG